MKHILPDRSVGIEVEPRPWACPSNHGFTIVSRLNVAFNSLLLFSVGPT